MHSGDDPTTAFEDYLHPQGIFIAVLIFINGKPCNGFLWNRDNPSYYIDMR